MTVGRRNSGVRLGFQSPPPSDSREGRGRRARTGAIRSRLSKPYLCPEVGAAALDWRIHCSWLGSHAGSPNKSQWAPALSLRLILPSPVAISHGSARAGSRFRVRIPPSAAQGWAARGDVGGGGRLPSTHICETRPFLGVPGRAAPTLARPERTGRGARAAGVACHPVSKGSRGQASAAALSVLLGARHRGGDAPHRRPVPTPPQGDPGHCPLSGGVWVRAEGSGAPSTSCGEVGTRELPRGAAPSAPGPCAVRGGHRRSRRVT